MSGRRHQKKKDRSVDSNSSPAAIPPPAPPVHQVHRRHESITIREERYQGIIPHPETLREYERVLPGAAQRIFDLADKQSDHRRALEQRNMGREIWAERFGTAAALAVAIYGLKTARDVALGDNPWSPFAGVGIAVGDIATLVALFIWGRKRNALELARKLATQEGR